MTLFGHVEDIWTGIDLTDDEEIGEQSTIEHYVGTTQQNDAENYKSICRN